MSEDMGFTIPFKGTQLNPTNVFVKQDAEYTAAGLYTCFMELHNNAI